MSEKKKVLVVDDESDVVQYLSSLLEDNGFTVICASDGQEAFDLVKKDTPDLISLDITMPNETGVRMLRNLHDDAKYSSIPVVIVSGVDPHFKQFISDRKQVNPPAAYFEKPIEKDDYIKKIKEILKIG